MDKGYYSITNNTVALTGATVAIHNKNGQGLLQKKQKEQEIIIQESQSTIKMDKGYYS